MGAISTFSAPSQSQPRALPTYSLICPADTDRANHGSGVVLDPGIPTVNKEDRVLADRKLEFSWEGRH